MGVCACSCCLENDNRARHNRDHEPWCTCDLYEHDEQCECDHCSTALNRHKI